MMDSAGDEREPVGALVHETLDTLGELVVAHLRLSRLEIESNLRRLAPRLAGMALATALALMGYGLMCVGICLDLASVMRLSSALLLLGAIHVVGGAVLVWRVYAGIARQRVLDATADEAQRSLDTIVDALRGDASGAV